MNEQEPITLDMTPVFANLVRTMGHDAVRQIDYLTNHHRSPMTLRDLYTLVAALRIVFNAFNTENEETMRAFADFRASFNAVANAMFEKLQKEQEERA